MATESDSTSESESDSESESNSERKREIDIENKRIRNKFSFRIRVRVRVRDSESEIDKKIEIETKYYEENYRKNLLRQMLREGEGEKDLERICRLRESNVESERNEYKNILRNMLTERGNRFGEDIERIREAFRERKESDPDTYTVNTIYKLVVNIIR